MLLDGVQDKHVGIQLEPSLLVHYASELLRPLELRWSGRQMKEKSLIGSIKPLEDFLNRLAVQTAAADAFGKMLLQPSQIDVLSRQGIVSFLKSEGVVPDKTGPAQHRIYLAVTL